MPGWLELFERVSALVTWRLADYTRSSPTGAGVGRVWKKNLHWSKPPDNWFVYVCDVDPNDGQKFYYGRPALIV